MQTELEAARHQRPQPFLSPSCNGPVGVVVDDERNLREWLLLRHKGSDGGVDEVEIAAPQHHGSADTGLPVTLSHARHPRLRWRRESLVAPTNCHGSAVPATCGN